MVSFQPDTRPHVDVGLPRQLTVLRGDPHYEPAFKRLSERMGYNRAERLSDEDKAGATLICRIAADGSRLEPTNHVFLPVAQPGQAPAGTVEGLGLLASSGARPAEARSTESEIERLSRIRRERVESRAVRLALRSLPDSALARRLYLPSDFERPIPPVQRDELDGSYVVAIQIRIGPDEVDKYRITAELEVDQEEGAPGPREDPDAEAFGEAPVLSDVEGPAEEGAHDSGDEAPVSTEPATELAE